MDKIEHVMSVSLITNIFLSGIKIFIGIFGQSNILIVDGIYSFCTFSNDLVATFENFLSKKIVGIKKFYEHRMIAYITNVMMSFVIVILGFLIIYTSLKKEMMIPSLFFTMISFILIIGKLLLSRYMLKKGKEYQNNMLLESGHKSNIDIIGSMIVFVSILMMQLSKGDSILKYAGIVAMTLVGIMVVKRGVSILKVNMSTMLEEQDTNSSYFNILSQLILKHKEIHHIDHLMVLNYDSYYKLIVEVSIDSDCSIKKVSQSIYEVQERLKLWNSKIRYVIIYSNFNPKYHLIPATKRDVKKIKEYRLDTIFHENVVDLEEKKKIECFVTNKLKKHWNSYFMIMVENKKVGTVGYYPIDSNTILIEEIFIEESYRHGKIGTSILKEIIINHLDFDFVLWVYKTNASALSLYRQLGFEPLEETETRIKLIYSI